MVQVVFQAQEDIHLFNECLELYARAGAWEGEFSEEEFHLVENVQKFGMSQEELDQEFSDVYEFQVEILQEVCPQINGSRLAALSKIENLGAFQSSYMNELKFESPFTDDVTISYEDFVEMNLNIFPTFYYKLGLEMEDLDSFKEKKFRNSSWGKEIHIYLDDIYHLIENISYSDGTKIAILDLYANLEESYETFIQGMQACKKAIERHYHLVEDRHKNLIQEINQGQGNELLLELFSMEKLIQQNPQVFEDLSQDETLGITLYIGPVSYNSARLQMQGDEELPYLRLDQEKEIISEVGILILDFQKYLRREKYSKEQIIGQAKALGDQVRFEILLHLEERPYYVKELAEKMGMTSASLSHHLSILNEAGFIVPELNERRTYYAINFEAFHDFGQYFTSLEHGQQMGRANQQKPD